MTASVWYQVFFHWPDGGIWSNLIASAIWATPTIIIGWRKLKRMHLHLHAKLDALGASHAELHEKLDRIAG